MATESVSSQKGSEKFGMGRNERDAEATDNEDSTKESSVDGITDELSKKKGLSLYRKNVLTVLALQIILLILMYAATYYNSLVHEIGWPVASIEDIVNYNFIGITAENPQPSAAAIIIEVLIWSFFGVAARQIYYVSLLILRNKDSYIDFLQVFTKILGESAMGVAISVAVVAFFLSTSLTIAGVVLTLQNANLLTIIALSFVLGFYHEDTRRLLGSFHKKLTDSDSKNEKDNFAVEDERSTLEKGNS